MSTYDTYHILMAGESIGEMLDNYGVQVFMNGDYGRQIASSFTQALASASRDDCHDSLEKCEAEVATIMGENQAHGFFCVIFKNGKLFAIQTRDSYKTFEAV